MQDKNLQQDTVQKTIRMEKDLIKKIDELRQGTERDFTKQVKFMLKEYIKIRENR